MHAGYGSVCRRPAAGGFVLLLLLAVGCRAPLPGPDAAAAALTHPGETAVLSVPGVGEVRLVAGADGCVEGDFGDGLRLRLTGPLYRGGRARTAWRDIDGDGTPDLLFRADLAADGLTLTVAFLRRPGSWERYVLPENFR